MSEKVTVIFPIEIISRELDGRLLLSSLFCKKYHRIFLMHSSLANRVAGRLKSGGLYVGKHIMAPTARDPSCYYKAKENKFIVVQSAEEGAVFMGQPRDWSLDLNFQLNPSVLSKEDYVATWGEWQKNHYINQGSRYPENVIATGHPRFELYKNKYSYIYDEEADQIKKKFGRYILFNANFSGATHKLKLSQVFSNALHYYPENPELRKKFVEQWAYQMQVVSEFVKLIHALVELIPDISIIVRPHPDDDISFFQSVFNGLEKVHVIREGCVAPWIIGSELLVHDGCTTAMEAFLARKPVFNFTPIRSVREIFLPNSIGYRVVTQEEALFKISQTIKNPVFVDKLIPKLADELFFNFKNNSVDSFLSVLERADMCSNRSKRETIDIFLEEKKALLIENAKKMVRPLFQDRFIAAEATKALFPGFQKNYIRRRLDSIEKITGKHMDIRYAGSSFVELGS